MRAGRDLLAAAALVALWLIPVWARVNLKPGDFYFLKEPESGYLLAAALVLFGLLKAAAFLAARVARRGSPAVRRVVLAAAFLSLLPVLNSIRHLALPFVEVPLLRRALLALLGLAAVFLLLTAVIVLARARFAPAAATGLLAALVILSPFAGISIGTTAIAWATLDATAEALWDPDVAGPVPDRAPARRVVVLLLDEFDARALDGPSAALMPHLAALRDRSVSIPDAYSPSDVTDRSVPALLTGRFVSDIAPAGPATAQIRFAEGGWADLASTPTVFSDARARSWNVGVVGWYHPYCRLFAESLAACHWEDGYVGIRDLSFPEAFALASGWAINSIPKTTDVVPIDAYQRQGMESLKRARTHAAAQAADPSLDLVFLHLNVPHPVGAAGTVRDLAGGGTVPPDVVYEANLRLADDIVGEILAALDASGLRARTTIVVTADHGFRGPVWGDVEAYPRTETARVPFLVDGPGGPATYPRGLNTIFLRPFLVELLAGGFPTREALFQWLHAQDVVGPGPANAYS